MKPLYVILVALQAAGGGAVWIAAGPGRDVPLLPDQRPRLLVAGSVAQPRSSQLSSNEAIDLDSLIQASFATPPAAAARNLAARASVIPGRPQDVSSPSALVQHTAEPSGQEPVWAPNATQQREFKRAGSLGAGNSGTSANLSLTPPLRDAVASLQPVRMAGAPAGGDQAAFRRRLASAQATALPGVSSRVSYDPAAAGHAGVSSLAAPRPSGHAWAAPARAGNAPAAGPAVDPFPGGSSNGAATFSLSAADPGADKPSASSAGAPKSQPAGTYDFYLNAARKQLGAKKLQNYQSDGDTILVAVRETQHSNHSYPDKFVFLKNGKAVQLSGSSEPSATGTGISMIKTGVYIGVPNGEHDGAPSWWIKTESGSGSLPDLRDSDGDGQYKGPGEAYNSKATQILLHIGRSSTGCLNYRPEDTQKVVNVIGGSQKRFVLVLI